jgi:hypothetical protein
MCKGDVLDKCAEGLQDVHHGGHLALGLEVRGEDGEGDVTQAALILSHTELGQLVGWVGPPMARRRATILFPEREG